MKNRIESLKGKGLLAMPHLKDPFFEQSLCYICQHNEQGTVGFVVNKPIKMLEQDLLLDQKFDVNPHEFQQPILSGGPIHTNRGFILHTHTAKWQYTAKIDENLYVTSSQEILAAVAGYKLTKNYLMVLGYAAWEPEQLETELLENDWLICDLNTELLFKIPFEQRWLIAMQRIGIQNPMHLMGISGHA